MASNKVLADGVQPTVTTVVSLYIAPLAGAGTRIIAFTATNSSATAAKYDVHIVPDGESASDSNRLIKEKGVAADDVNVPLAIQNHLIPAGGELQVKVSTGTTIAFRATGIEF
jgi:hypothetical protein